MRSGEVNTHNFFGVFGGPCYKPFVSVLQRGYFTSVISKMGPKKHQNIQGHVASINGMIVWYGTILTSFSPLSLSLSLSLSL